MSFHCADGSGKSTSPFRLVQRSGVAAHETVPPSHWCVKKQDLKELRAVVREEVAKGHMLPTALDPFDPDDNVYGPSVHTVVQQMMKPISEISGGSSFALIRHPSGLKCDLFVTHGWAEGIYEFIDKVLASWPRGTKHAYCCMLSNPQTLDIGSIIAHPGESPFANALKVASHVLVVPNRQSSIYSRCWCTYEAYLAYKWNKTILVARAPLAGVRFKLLLFLVFALISGGAHSMFVRSTSEAIIDRIMFFEDFTSMWLKIAMVFVEQVACFPDLVLLAVFFLETGNQTIYAVGHALADCEKMMCTCKGIELYLFVPFYMLSAMMGLGFFFCVWLDGEQEIRMRVETEQLQSGYSGSIRSSSASIEQDKMMILQEISQNEEDLKIVDRTIEVLLKSGMSTEALRLAHEKGVDVSGVGVLKTRLVCVGMHAFSCSAYLAQLHGKRTASNIVLLLSMMVCVLAFFCQRKDKVALLAVAIWKLFGFPFVLCRMLLGLKEFFDIDCPLEKPWELLTTVSPYIGCILAFVPLLDLGILASIPVFGKFIAQNMVTSRMFNLRWLFFRRQELGSASSIVEIELVQT